MRWGKPVYRPKMLSDNSLSFWVGRSWSLAKLMLHCAKGFYLVVMDVSSEAEMARGGFSAELGLAHKATGLWMCNILISPQY